MTDLLTQFRGLGWAAAVRGGVRGRVGHLSLAPTPPTHTPPPLPLQYKMFEATRWTFASADGVLPIVLRAPGGGDYTILQRFDFDHARMTQSVVVRAPDGGQAVYVKGSFEKIGALCRPASLPADYAAVAQAHAMNGCYVLALATRELGPAGAEVRGERGEEKGERGGGRPRPATHSALPSPAGRAGGLEAAAPGRHGGRPDLPRPHHLPQRAAPGFGRDDRPAQGERAERRGRMERVVDGMVCDPSTPHSSRSAGRLGPRPPAGNVRSMCAHHRADMRRNRLARMGVVRT
jgi:hypothetical protein